MSLLVLEMFSPASVARRGDSIRSGLAAALSCRIRVIEVIRCSPGPGWPGSTRRSSGGVEGVRRQGSGRRVRRSFRGEVAARAMPEGTEVKVAY